MSILAEAMRADDDLERVQLAGLGATQASVGRLRSGFMRALQARDPAQFSARSEMLNHWVPSLSRTLAVAHLMGRRRSILSAREHGFALDRFSEVMRMVRDAGLGEDLTKLQRGYARRVYDSMRHMGTNIDARTRAVIASLIAEGEPPGRAMKILNATLDKLGVGGQSQAKLETIYRTEASIAYHAGRWQQDQKNPAVWGYRYVTMHDDRVRPEHAALDGTTLEKNAIFWKRYFPPNGWNCRCQVVTLYKKTKTRNPGKLNGKVPLPDAEFRKNFSALGVVEFALDWEHQPRVKAGHEGGGQWTSATTWPAFACSGCFSTK